MITRRAFLGAISATAVCALFSLSGCGSGNTSDGSAKNVIPIFDVKSFQQMTTEEATSSLKSSGYDFVGTGSLYVSKSSMNEAVNTVFGIDAQSNSELFTNDGQIYLVNVPLDNRDSSSAKLPSSKTDFNSLIDEMMSAAGFNNPTSRGTIDSQYSDNVTSVNHGTDAIKTDWTNYYAVGSCDVDGVSHLWAVCIDTCTYSTYDQISTNANWARFYCGKANGGSADSLVEQMSYWSKQSNQESSSEKSSYFKYSDRGNYMGETLVWWEKGK